MIFDAGESIRVVKKDGDWWTGVIGTRTGIFPANYVQPVDNNVAPTNSSVVPQQIAADLKSMSINGTQEQCKMSAEEARHQADIDSEVSQINTQNVVNDSSMQELRGMTASAV